MPSTRPTEILIRRAYEDDAADLVRLAVLDSAAAPPQAPLLVAELDGVLSVALSLVDGAAIADPFKPTADVLELLRMRAASGAQNHERRRRPHIHWQSRTRSRPSRDRKERHGRRRLQERCFLPHKHILPYLDQQ